MHADVEFSAIVDPNTELAHQRVADLQKGKYAEKWSKTKVFPHYRDLLNSPVSSSLRLLMHRYLLLDFRLSNATFGDYAFHYVSLTVWNEQE